MSFIRLWVEASREGREERLSCTSFREDRLSCSSFREEKLSCSSFKEERLSGSSFREDRLSCSSFKEERLWPTHLSIVRSDWVGSDHDQVLVRLFFRLNMDLRMVTW